MATPRFAGSYSGSIPAATGLMVNYLRDPAQFKLNEYAQYLKTDKRVALYAKLERDQQARVVSDADSVWADGADSPSGNADLMRWEMVEFRTTRRAYAFQIGEMAIESAKGTWDPLLAHSKSTAMRAMTNRTKRVVDLLETDGTWEGHVATANDLNGGYGTWDTASDDPASPHYNAIFKTITEAVKRIMLDTNSVVQLKDLVMILSPGAAIRMANSAEVHNYVKHGMYSLPRLMGKGESNAIYHLPPDIYGLKVVVEDAGVVTTRPMASGAAGTRTFIKSDDSAIIVSRKGGIDGGLAGSHSWSTVQLYFYGSEMQVEAFSDPKNRRVDGRVSEDFKEIVPSGISGYKISGILS